MLVFVYCERRTTNLNQQGVNFLHNQLLNIESDRVISLTFFVYSYPGHSNKLIILILVPIITFGTDRSTQLLRTRAYPIVVIV